MPMSTLIQFNTYDPYGLFGVDDVWGGIYSATGCWSPNQTTVNVAAGFGDGVSSVLSLGLYNTADFRDDLGIDGGVNECSASYEYSKYVGYTWGIGTFGIAGLNGGKNSVFYSPSVKSREYAQTLGQTINNTPVGKFANWIGIKNNAIWKLLSKIYAHNAKGRAKTVLRTPRNQNSIWDKVEKPILTRRGIPIDYY